MRGELPTPSRRRHDRKGADPVSGTARSPRATFTLLEDGTKKGPACGGPCGYP